MKKRTFVYRSQGSKIYVKHIAFHSDNTDKEDELCQVTKHDANSWADYVAGRLNFAEEFLVSGLTIDELRAIVRMYRKEDTTN